MNWGWRAGMQGFNERPPPIPLVAERLEGDIDGFGWMNRRPAPIDNAPRWFDLLDDERKAEEERKAAERQKKAAEEERKAAKRRQALLRPLEFNHEYSCDWCSELLKFAERDPERNDLLGFYLSRYLPLPYSFKDYPIEIVQYDLIANRASPYIKNRHEFNIERIKLKRSMDEKLNTIESFILNSRFFEQPVKRMQIFELAEEQEMKEYWKNYENYPEIQTFIELQIETLRTGGQKRKMRRKRISKKLRK